VGIVVGREDKGLKDGLVEVGEAEGKFEGAVEGLAVVGLFES